MLCHYQTPSGTSFVQKREGVIILYASRLYSARITMNKDMVVVSRSQTNDVYGARAPSPLIVDRLIIIETLKLNGCSSSDARPNLLSSSVGCFCFPMFSCCSPCLVQTKLSPVSDTLMSLYNLFANNEDLSKSQIKSLIRPMLLCCVVFNVPL